MSGKLLIIAAMMLAASPAHGQSAATDLVRCIAQAVHAESTYSDSSRRVTRFDVALDSLACIAISDTATRTAIRHRAELSREHARAVQIQRAQLRARQWAQAIQAKGWPDDATRDVLAHQISIGMTAEMVRSAWGRPTHINRTITVAHTTEQWVYSSDYVYLEDGVVTSIQQSR